MFFKKRGILRKSIQQQIKLIDTLKKECQMGNISEQECADITSQWSEIASLLQKIAPPQALSKQQLVLRLLLVLSMSTILGLGGWALFRFNFSSMGQTIVSNIESEGITATFVPEQKVVVDDFPQFQQISYSDSSTLFRSERMDETVIGIYPMDNLVKVAYTKANGQQRIIVLDTVHPDTGVIVGQQTLVQDGDVMDGSFVKSENGFLLAYGMIQDNQERIFLRSFDADWNPVNSPILLDMVDPKEVVSGLSLSKSPSGDYLLISTKIRSVDASVLEKAVPIMRIIDDQLQVKQSKMLGTKQYNVDTGMSGVISQQGGLNLFVNANNPLMGQDIRGDELFLFSYDETWELIQIYQLTVNGRRHDFQPSQVVETENGEYLIPGLQTEVFEREGSVLSYPPYTGKVFIRALSPFKKIIGTITVGDFSPVFDSEQLMEGGRNIHIFFDPTSNRLYTAFDLIVTNDNVDKGEGGDGEYRKVMLKWYNVML